MRTAGWNRSGLRRLRFNMDNKPPASAMYKGMIFMVIGNFLMAYVFAHNMAWFLFPGRPRQCGVGAKIM